MKNIKFIIVLMVAFVILTACKERIPSPLSTHTLDEVPAYDQNTYEVLSYSLGCWDIENLGYSGDAYNVGGHLARKITVYDGGEYFFFEEDWNASCIP